MVNRIYTYSQLSASSAAELVAAKYAIQGPLRGKFYMLGLHDNYLLESPESRYILRIYRNDWRSPEHVYFELELLACLRERNVPVAWPMSTIDGELSFRVESPEGERIATLFHYAAGRAPADSISTDDCVVLGRTVANVHHEAETFRSDHARPALDLHYLVDESIMAIRPFLESDAQSYVDGLQKGLRLSWPDIPREPGMFGICIGDVNPTNFHITSDRAITLFDFDQCGFGFRAFEIAKFASSLRSHSMKRALVCAFLNGYQERRVLSRVEREAIPYFEMVAHLWVMAIHVENVNRIGYKRLEKPYWDRSLAILKELEAQRGAPADIGADAPPGRT